MPTAKNCTAALKSGKRCKRKASNGQFCNYHRKRTIEENLERVKAIIKTSGEVVLATTTLLEALRHIAAYIPWRMIVPHFAFSKDQDEPAIYGDRIRFLTVIVGRARTRKQLQVAAAQVEDLYNRVQADRN